MENTKDLSAEDRKSTASKVSAYTKNSESDAANLAATAAQRARESVQSAYEETKQVVNDAYGKTTEALTGTYDQAMVYGKENPGKLTLIAFGAGIGFGVLVASGFGGRRRNSRFTEPIVNALSQVALEFFR
jgi:ElaB/YqjD/DUF883 family membrane-anchored ribosome-binding protein